MSYTVELDEGEYAVLVAVFGQFDKQLDSEWARGVRRLVMAELLPSPSDALRIRSIYRALLKARKVDKCGGSLS
jgi:hypothetical protein